MNLNFTPEKPNLFIRDSIKSNKQFNLTDNKSKSYKKEDDPFFSINSSKTSQEIKNKYNEISEIKSKTTNKLEQDIENDEGVINENCFIKKNPLKLKYFEIASNPNIKKLKTLKLFEIPPQFLQIKIFF